MEGGCLGHQEAFYSGQPIEKKVSCPEWSGVSLSFEVGGHLCIRGTEVQRYITYVSPMYQRVAGQKITLEVNFFMFSLKVGRY